MWMWAWLFKLCVCVRVCVWGKALDGFQKSSSTVCCFITATKQPHGYKVQRCKNGFSPQTFLPSASLPLLSPLPQYSTQTLSGNKSTISFISLQLYELDCVCADPQHYTKFIHFGFLNRSYAIIKSFVLKETQKETPYFAHFAIIGIGGKSPQSAQTKQLITPR